MNQASPSQLMQLMKLMEPNRPSPQLHRQLSPPVSNPSHAKQLVHCAEVNLYLAREV